MGERVAARPAVASPAMPRLSARQRIGLRLAGKPSSAPRDIQRRLRKVLARANERAAAAGERAETVQLFGEALAAWQYEEWSKPRGRKGSHTPGGRLELTWTNKDWRLLAREDGSWDWVKPSDYRVAEVRLLHHVAKAGDPSSENLLIRGDALSALASLSRVREHSERYVGQVKLA